MECTSCQKIFNRCPECGSTNIIHDYETGEIICGNCGLVLHEQMLSKRPERQAFTQEEKTTRRRFGAPVKYSVYDKGLPSTITRIGRDAFGRKLPLSTRLQMWRLRQWQIRSKGHSSVDRNLALAMSELNRISDKLSIPPSVKENAAIIYRKALSKGLIRGRSIVAITSAALYAACRASKIPRTLEELAEVSLIKRKDLSRCYRLLLSELTIQMPVADPIAYVSKIAEKTKISGEIQGLAVEILRKAKSNGTAAGKDPIGLAAAALYLACLQNNKKKSQKVIAEASGVTEVTIRNRYKTLKNLTQIGGNKNE